MISAGGLLWLLACAFDGGYCIIACTYLYDSFVCVATSEPLVAGRVKVVSQLGEHASLHCVPGCICRLMDGTNLRCIGCSTTNQSKPQQIQLAHFLIRSSSRTLGNTFFSHAWDKSYYSVKGACTAQLLSSLNASLHSFSGRSCNVFIILGRNITTT